MESKEARDARIKPAYERLEKEEREFGVVITNELAYQDAKERDREKERELLGLRKKRAQHGRDIQLAKAKKKRRSKK
jgi:hypothetical protein